MLSRAAIAQLPCLGLRESLEIHLDQEMQKDTCQIFYIFKNTAKSAPSLHMLTVLPEAHGKIQGRKTQDSL